MEQLSYSKASLSGNGEVAHVFELLQPLIEDLFSALPVLLA
jgi:hypothetical protein